MSPSSWVARTGQQDHCPTPDCSGWKGRVQGADTVTVTKNEILTALNKPEDCILALVFVVTQGPEQPRYITRPFDQEPDFATASVNVKIKELLPGAQTR